MSKVPEWVTRDLRRQEARQRIVEEARLALLEQAKKKKHKYVANSKATWYGPHPCAECGKPEDDPDHDGDSMSNDTDRDMEHAEIQETADEPHTSVMVALFPNAEAADRLAIKGGEKAAALHVTLAYLGKAVDLGDTERLLTVVQGFAASHQPLSGNVNGLGLFTNPSGVVTWAAVDVPSLPEFRDALVKVLDSAGFKVGRDHGYTPHMTLAYADRRDDTPPNVDLMFDSVTVAIAGEQHAFDLTGTGKEVAEQVETKWGVPSLPMININLNPGGYYLTDRTNASLLAPVKPHAYEHPASPGQKMPDGIPRDLMGISPITFPPCAVCGQMYGEPVHNINDGGDPNTIGIQGAPAYPIAQMPGLDTLQKAFVTEAFGRTMLTAPANVWEKALSSNEHMMWMQGRFVGGEKPNRNNALWSNRDLELGHTTVAHGPLNWLHESRHVIGTIADARLIPGKSSGNEQANVDESHIVAMSAVWKWLYPDEAWVIANASDSGKLWYSMECISKNVECVGEGSCGEKASYGDYLKGNGCRHMRERSATRRFDEPTFLGGAVIVPPVRPGWADADARVLHSEAAAMAERTFDQANPQLSANEWEKMMGEILRFASA